jgi:hypothetical protein
MIGDLGGDAIEDVVETLGFVATTKRQFGE